MTSVQLERLRPQIIAITSQYENSDVFTNSLIALLKLYKGEIDYSSTKIKSFSIIPRMNVPLVVINQLEISLKHLAKIYPDQTKIIVKNLWEQVFFETKKIAVFLLSNLPSHENNTFFNIIEGWVNEDIEQPILQEIFENISKIKMLSQDPIWLLLIETWLSSKIERFQKIGLMALVYYIQSSAVKNLPTIFHLAEPLLSNPHISINTELLELVKSLIETSQPETAAFLIHLSVLYPKPETFSFIRKCISLFNPYFANEIKKNTADL